MLLDDRFRRELQKIQTLALTENYQASITRIIIETLLKNVLELPYSPFNAVSKKKYIHLLRLLQHEKVSG